MYFANFWSLQHQIDYFHLTTKKSDPQVERRVAQVMEKMQADDFTSVHTWVINQDISITDEYWRPGVIMT